MSTTLRWMLLCLVILLAALVAQIEFFAYAVWALLAIFLVSQVMGRVALRGLAIERHCNKRQAEIGEAATVTLEVKNDKPLPVPWIVVEDLIPRRLRADGERSLAVLMLPFRTRKLQYRLALRHRGYHQVGPLVLESGDFFGLVRRFQRDPAMSFVTVLPRIVPIGRWSIASRKPIGEVLVQSGLHEDPTRVCGVRPYMRGDPLNRIHWKATARTARLHSRVYEHSTLIGANVVLDFSETAWREANCDPPPGPAPFPPPPESEQDEAWFLASELAVTVAGSIAAFVVEEKQRVGLITNGGDAAERVEWEMTARAAETRDEARLMAMEQRVVSRLRPVQVPPQKGPAHMARILETLAHLELREGLSCADMISNEYESWPREASLLVIVPALPADLVAQLARLRSAGFIITVFVIRNQEEYLVGRARLAAEHIGVIHVRDDRDLDQVAVPRT